MKISEATETTFQVGDSVPIYRSGQAAGDKLRAICPVWTDYAPTFGGFSVAPTVIAKYLVIGKMCIYSVNPTAHGTSNSTTANGKTITLPVVPRAVGNQNFHSVRVVNNNAGLAGPGLLTITQNNSTAVVFRDGVGSTAWTDAQPCSFGFTIIYETA